MLPLLIFDLDGTLLDSERGIVVSAQRALRDFSIIRSDHEVREQIGLELEPLINQLLHSLDEKRLLQSICEHFREYYRIDVFEHTKIYPGVVETLQALSHVKKGIATNKRHPTVHPVTDYFNLSQYFDHIQGYVPGEIEAKPAPDMILHIIKQLGGNAKNTIFIGDTDKDITASRAAGVKIVAVTYGIYSREVLLKSSPDYLIDSFPELLKIVEKFS